MGSQEGSTAMTRGQLKQGEVVFVGRFKRRARSTVNVESFLLSGIVVWLFFFFLMRKDME